MSTIVRLLFAHILLFGNPLNIKNLWYANVVPTIKDFVCDLCLQ